MEIKRAQLSSSTAKSPAQKSYEWLVDNSGRLIISVFCVFIFLAALYVICGIINFLITHVGRETTDGTMGIFMNPLTAIFKLIGSGVIVWHVLKNKSSMK